MSYECKILHEITLQRYLLLRHIVHENIFEVLELTALTKREEYSYSRTEFLALMLNYGQTRELITIRLEIKEPCRSSSYIFNMVMPRS
jgi:hypothetical protein